MKALRRFTAGWVAVGALVAGLLLSGCQSEPKAFTEVRGVSEPPRTVYDVFRVGDQVLITFSGASSFETPIQPYRDTVKDDGTITPPNLKPVVTVGKTPGQVQKELQDRYNELYQHLTVTVIPTDRYYYVTGEVKIPGPRPYLGETDIVKAISAAGDFTEFAKKTKVRLTRANGRSQVVNVKKIINDPQFDVPVYPGDKIYVPRSIW
jgi:protein involved in polysaccharide export with SLBB domain